MPAVTPSGRLRRKTAVDVDYKVTPSRAPRGSPKNQTKSHQDTTTPKAVAAPVVDTPKRRGRPPKTSTAETTSPKEVATTVMPVKAARGRPKRSGLAAVPTFPLSPKRKRDDEEPEPAPPKKRGRPAKGDTTTTEVVAKKRGRPARVDSAPAAPKSKRSLAVSVQEKEPTKAATKIRTAAKPKTSAKTPAKPPAKRGRPAGRTNKTTTATKAAKTTKKAAKAKPPKWSTESEAESLAEGLTQEEQDDGDLQYWLLKAEPATRIEKGVDVSYPIEKLAAATEPEPWDGKC